jgi:CRISPR-associated protein Cmr2
MSDAILIFTFSPVQSFITEARRASDLHIGSRILVYLAKAAAQVLMQQGTLIYPAPLLQDDVPNKLVARVSWEEAREIAEKSKAALLREWTRIADTAKNELMSKEPLPDARWHDNWTRQISHLWEIYWAAALLDGRSYRDVYLEAIRALDAAKRTRVFDATEEHGLKDTLSGCREALYTNKANAKSYWAKIGEQVGAAKLRPEGRERLDAIGAVKRFSEIADASRFPSTSTVASGAFLERARRQLAGYREVIEILLGPHLYRVREDRDWPYDGDLLFRDTLATKRLENSYGASELDEDWLQEARKVLSAVYHAAEMEPSAYYALIALDGDNMGKRVNECQTEAGHTELSCKLATFAGGVKPIVEEQYQGNLIYNGGDDVLALAPLSSAFPLAQTLASSFKEVTGGTASVGIAIVHHLYPLSTAFQQARQAEKQAKIPPKAAVCVRVLKRSGEIVEMRSPWNAVGDTFADVIGLFQGDAQGEPLSSKFAYDVLHAAYALPEANEQSQAELKRLLTRHHNAKHPRSPDPGEWAERLRAWAAALPGQLEELGRWLVFARFVAQGGRE